MKCSLLSLIILKTSLSHPIVILYFFALIAEEGFLLSLLFYEILDSYKYIFPFLLCFLLLFFPQLFVRPPQTAILLFCISFSWGWSWFLSPVQCHEPPSIVHQALLRTGIRFVSLLILPLQTKLNINSKQTCWDKTWKLTDRYSLSTWCQRQWVILECTGKSLTWYYIIHERKFETFWELQFSWTLFHTMFLWK